MYFDVGVVDVGLCFVLLFIGVVGWGYWFGFEWIVGGVVGGWVWFDYCWWSILGFDVWVWVVVLFGWYYVLVDDVVVDGWWMFVVG